MFDAKKSLISSLISAKDIVNSMNKEKEDEKDYLTYLTTKGWVTGKTFNVRKIDVSSKEEVLEALQDKDKGLDALSIALSMHKKIKKESGIEDIEPNRAIFLEDASIKDQSSKIVNVNLFVLFSDQVIGVLPGKMDLELLND